MRSNSRVRKFQKISDSKALVVAQEVGHLLAAINDLDGFSRYTPLCESNRDLQPIFFMDSLIQYPFLDDEQVGKKVFTVDGIKDEDKSYSNKEEDWINDMESPPTFPLNLNHDFPPLSTSAVCLPTCHRWPMVVPPPRISHATLMGLCFMITLSKPTPTLITSLFKLGHRGPRIMSIC
ncbi:hypothetical protein L2E82_18913 [Cichorium intybus]|uniref:Uncharacterized protein n=1 Tax=Cichorium intybus TaxID=13427 RepID=A0ACB9FBQ3_CICIN|nr:hypothetical protein L2E82_18913 [Cichorium intybus]